MYGNVRMKRAFTRNIEILDVGITEKERCILGYLPFHSCNFIQSNVS